MLFIFVAVPKRINNVMDPPEADSHICSCAKAHRQIWKKRAVRRSEPPNEERESSSCWVCVNRRHRQKKQQYRVR